jgi:hypothetical protein
MTADRKPPHAGLDYQGRHADIEQPDAPRWARAAIGVLCSAALITLLLILLGL